MVNELNWQQKNTSHLHRFSRDLLFCKRILHMFHDLHRLIVILFKKILFFLCYIRETYANSEKKSYGLSLLVVVSSLFYCSFHFLFAFFYSWKYIHMIKSCERHQSNCRWMFLCIFWNWTLMMHLANEISYMKVLNMLSYLSKCWIKIFMHVRLN